MEQDVLTEQRINIKFLVKLGKSELEIIEMLKIVYGESAMKRRSVYEWVNRFQEGRENVEDDARAGHPSTSRLDENIQRAHDLVLSDCHMTARVIAADLRISKGSVQTILKEDLNKRKPCGKIQDQQCVDFSQDMIENDEDFNLKTEQQKTEWKQTFEEINNCISRDDYSDVSSSVMSTDSNAMSIPTVLVKHEIKQEIDEEEIKLEINEEELIKQEFDDEIDIKTEIDIEEHNIFLKNNIEQTVNVPDEIDPLATDPREDAENSTQSVDSKKLINSEKGTAKESVSKAHICLVTGKQCNQCHVCKKAAQSTNIQCIVCKKKFRSNSDLKRHLLIHTGEKPHECDICKKRFNLSSNLVTHLRMHSGEKPYECKICKKKFGDSSKLSRHLRIHTGEKPHECEICKRTFTQSSNLMIHMRLHTGEKPYECTICNIKYTNPTSLKKHAVLHSGEKPHECTRCGKTFAQSSHLSVHLRTHTGEKPHECPVCKKKFIQTGQLKTHLRSHTGEKPYKCSECGQNFSQAVHLATHVVRFHSGE